MSRLSDVGPMSNPQPSDGAEPEDCDDSWECPHCSIFMYEEMDECDNCCRPKGCSLDDEVLE